MEIPRIAYFTAIRFVKLSAFAAGSFLIGWAIPYWIEFCSATFGSPYYGIAPLFLIPMILASYIVAKWDVQEEKRKQEKVYERLRKD